MAKKVDHDRRRREIAARALRLFSRVGFNDVSFNMIAGDCGVSRTTLYQYFGSKREILDAAILSATGEMRARCRPAVARRGPVGEKVEAVCHAVIDVLFENRDFLVAVFGFIFGQVRTGNAMNGPIVGFTSGVRETLARLLAHGCERGEFASGLDVGRAVDVLYAVIESSALRLVFGLESDATAAHRRLAAIVRAVSVKKGDDRWK